MVRTNANFLTSMNRHHGSFFTIQPAKGLVNPYSISDSFVFSGGKNRSESLRNENICELVVVVPQIGSNQSQ